ncbi:MAG: agmatine deiminase [Gammaproteobacteria bacterium]|nr:agmatine deiminase [Gammaproteobacteria bacterium]
MSYYLPPEWAEQSAVMLTWPHENSQWFPSLQAVEKSFIAIAKAVTQYEALIVSCLNVAHLSHVKSVLLSEHIDLSNVYLYIAASNDVWARDHGPLTIIKEGKLQLLDFKFNGWGNKYPSDLDDQITRLLYQQEAFPNALIESIDYVLEGGSVEVDGKGTLMTTESCLLSKQRNAGYGKNAIEILLKKYLGVDRILWLEHGYLAGDDTDGHIDTLARFTDPNTIAYVHCDDPEDEHFIELSQMADELKAFRNAQGEPYRLIPLPWPAAKYAEEGRRLPATYANFLIINGAVLMPVYDDPSDEKALSQIKICFPDRHIIPIPCRHLIEQYGSLHCVTMQIPAVP